MSFPAAETEGFELYHRRYCEAATSIHDMMDKLGGERYAREQDSLAEQIESRLKEMDNQLQRMKFELSHMTNPATAEAYEKKVKSLQGDASNLRQIFKAKRAHSQRAQLYGSSSAGTAVRGQLLSNQAALDRSAARLEEGLSALEETEQIGGGVLQSLAEQRETLELTRTTLNTADEMLTTARRHLTDMGRRLAANKAAMYCIILALVALIIYVMVRKIA